MKSYNLCYRHSFSGPATLAINLLKHFECKHFKLLTQWSNQAFGICHVSYKRQVDKRAFLERKWKHALIQHHNHRMAPRTHGFARPRPQKPASWPALSERRSYKHRQHYKLVGYDPRGWRPGLANRHIRRECLYNKCCFSMTGVIKSEVCSYREK